MNENLLWADWDLTVIFHSPWGLIDGWDYSGIGTILLVDVNSIIIADNFLDALTKRDDCFTVVFVLKTKS